MYISSIFVWFWFWLPHCISVPINDDQTNRLEHITLKVLLKNYPRQRHAQLSNMHCLTIQIKDQKFDDAINYLSLELENHPKVMKSRALTRNLIEGGGAFYSYLQFCQTDSFESNSLKVFKQSTFEYMNMHPPHPK